MNLCFSLCFVFLPPPTRHDFVTPPPPLQQKVCIFYFLFFAFVFACYMREAKKKILQSFKKITMK